MKRVWRYAGKAIVGVCALGAAAVSSGMLHGPALVVVEGALVIAGGLGIYHAPADTTALPKV